MKLNIFCVCLLMLPFLFSCKEQTEQNLLQKPNVIFILADDMGYSDIGCFGGEIETPNIDRIAQNGIRFTDFYNASRCCPSRATLLTGKYPHEVGMGCMTDWPPNAENGPYQGFLPDGQSTLASVLKQEGYKNYMVGKWHLGEEKEHWPLKYGFDKYFGLISGASSYFELIKNQPRVRKMVHNTYCWEPPAEDFYITSAFSDSAVSYIDQHNTDEPFFLYLAYTAPHWPIHALDKDIARFEGKYMEGFEQASAERFERMKQMMIIPGHTIKPEPPASLPDWESLTLGEKKQWDRLMAVYAAMIYRMDVGIGKVIDKLKEKGMYENTVIMIASDNGATDADISGRKLNNPNVKAGQRGSYLSYLEPWAWVSNTPYQEYKKSSFYGGIRTPFILSYPKFTKNRNELSAYRAHFIDVLPTMLGLAETKSAKVENYEGVDFSPLIYSNTLSEECAKRPLFFEHMGNKSVTVGDWKLLKTTWEPNWELYNINEDVTEINNLITEFPEKAEELLNLYKNWEKRTNSFSLPETWLE